MIWQRPSASATDILTVLRTLVQQTTAISNTLASMFAAAYGTASAYVTAAAVIKAAPGRVATILVVVPGSGGNFTLNDTTTTGGATTANEIFTTPFNATEWVAGAILRLNWPCAAGIVVSAVPSGGGQVSIAYS
jgi:hypothetical protein